MDRWGNGYKGLDLWSVLLCIALNSLSRKMNQKPIYVTAETALNRPYPVSKVLSCFLETVDQNCKSCSWSMCRGENFDLRQHPEPVFHPPQSQRAKNLSSEILSEAKGPLSRKIQCWSPFTILYPKGPSSKALQWKPTRQCFRLPAFFPQLRKAWLNPQSGRQIWALLPVSLLADLAIKLFLSSEANATVLASVCIGQRALCRVTISYCHKIKRI